MSFRCLVSMSYSTVHVAEEAFGALQSTRSNETVSKFTLTNDHGGQVELITYGAAMASLRVPDKTGQLRDVVLGFDNVDGTQYSNFIYVFERASAYFKYSPLRFIHS